MAKKALLIHYQNMKKKKEKEKKKKTVDSW